jgi:hypothetical protein
LRAASVEVVGVARQGWWAVGADRGDLGSGSVAGGHDAGVGVGEGKDSERNVHLYDGVFTREN